MYKIVYKKFGHNDMTIDVMGVIGGFDVNTESPFQLKPTTYHFILNFIHNYVN